VLCASSSNYDTLTRQCGGARGPRVILLEDPMKVASFLAMIRNRVQRKAVYNQAAYWDAKAESYPDNAAAMWPDNHYNEIDHADQIALFDAFLPDVRGKRSSTWAVAREESHDTWRSGARPFTESIFRKG
jgi:hypothetical protein